MSSIAQFPVNVRLEHQDGTRTPLEFICEEQPNEDGTTTWTSVHEYPKKDGDQLAWDLCPSKVKLDVRYQS